MLLTGKFQRLVPTIVCCFVFHIALFGQHDDSWTELIEKYAQLMEKGEYLNALTAIEQAARIAKDFSPSDSRKWQSTLQLADTLDRVGRIDDALKVYNGMLAGELGDTPNEPTKSRLLLSIGRIQVLKNRFQDAESSYMRALDIGKSYFSEDNPLLAPTLIGLAGFYLSQGRHIDALPYAEWAVRVTTPGQDTSLLRAQALESLGWVYNGLRQFQKAQPLFEQSLSIMESHYGPDHPALVAPIENLAALHLMQRHLANAQALFRRSLATNERTIGKDNPALATTINDLALTLDPKKDKVEMELLLKRSLELTEKRFGPGSSRLATGFMNIGSFYEKNSNLVQAEAFFRRAVDIQLADPQAKDGAFAALALDGLARILITLKRLDEAERLALQALEIQETKNGPFDPSIVGSLRTLSDVYAEMKKGPQAIVFAKRAVSITEALPGIESTEYRGSLLILASAYHRAGQLRDAETVFVKVIDLYEKSGEFAALSKALRQYAEVLQRTNRAAQARALKKRADELEMRELPELLIK